MLQQFDSVVLPVPCNFIKSKTLAQVLSCQFCKNFKNTYFEEHQEMAVSNNLRSLLDFRARFTVH